MMPLHGGAPRVHESSPSLRTRFVRVVAVFGTLAMTSIVLAPLVGSTHISLRAAFDFSRPFADNPDAQIFFIARLPRTLAAAVVGALLASAGVVFQGLLRNPLATPFTLGISAGAALGAMLALTFHWSLSAVGIPAVTGASFAGAIAAVAVVYALARARHRGLSTTVLLLAGVTLNAFLSALILLVQYFADFADTYRALRWLMGDLDVSSYEPLVAALPLGIAAFVAFAWLARPLNLLALGTDSAESRGLNVAAAQRTAFLSASLATGAAVSIAGPIGFVGIIIPHLVRLLTGPRPPHRAAGIGPVRRGVPRRLRRARADDARARRAAGRDHHRPARRPVLPVAAHQKSLTAVALAALLAAGAAPTVTVRTEALRPRRIVSLIPAVTEMLFAIGAGPQVKAVSSYDTNPPEVRSLPRVGALLDPDVERILALAPDLVVVYATADGLETTALAGRHSDVRLSARRSCRRDRDVAGHRPPDRTRHRSRRACVRHRRRSRRVARIVAGRRRPRTLLVFGRERGTLRGIYASGGVGFLHDMLTAGGGENVYADVKQQAVQATTEAIIARQPDVILEVRSPEGAAGFAPSDSDIEAWKPLSSVPAVRDGRIYFLVDDRIVVPGPGVAQGTLVIARTLHPEAFR